MFKTKFQRRISYVVFGIYFVLLVWLVLFKLHIHFEEVYHIPTINMIPFWYDTNTGFLLHLQEMFYNVLAFIPLGVFAELLRPEWPFGGKLFLCFSVSFLFELLQFVFALGVSDITDLITNTLGGGVGILLYALFRKLFGEKSIPVVNLLGAASELSAITLLAVLLIANS